MFSSMFHLFSDKPRLPSGLCEQFARRSKDSFQKQYWNIIFLFKRKGYHRELWVFIDTGAFGNDCYCAL